VSRIPIILNPSAGGGRLLRARRSLEETAQKARAEIEWWTTTGPGHAEELARRAVAEDRSLVFAFGGDGTYNEVARGLLGSATAMGILPGGTTSVLAYELGVPRPAPRALRSLLDGEDGPLHVGRTDRGDIVLLMLSAGPDSHVLEHLMPRLKRLGGRVGVALQAVFELCSGSDLPRMEVGFAGKKVDAGWVVVGKSRCYAGRHRVTPGADPSRADFEVVIQKSSGRVPALRFLFGVPSGRHLGRSDVVREIVDRVTIRPAQPDATVFYQIDGDVVGRLPVELVIDPQTLWVRLPA
jgi:diacylglycerol kinase (ATP)